MKKHTSKTFQFVSIFLDIVDPVFNINPEQGTCLDPEICKGRFQVKSW